MTKHNRKFVMSSAADFNERTRHTIVAGVKVRDKFEELIGEKHFIDKAPFSWISFVLCYVNEDRHDIVLKNINKKNGSLAVSAYWNYDEIKAADAQGSDK